MSPPGLLEEQALDTAKISNDSNEDSHNRKRIVVVGLGMVGISFIEKVMKLDSKRREYEIIVIGEEEHLAYNRVGLTSFFQHRNPESLYLNSKDWYSNASTESFNYHLNTKVTEIIKEQKLIKTSMGETVAYDILVLATGSDALLPRNTPGLDAKGVFVYRTIEDLQKLIQYAETVKGTIGAVVGGGLLGLEAAKAMMDLESFKQVKLLERNRWVLSRQLDQDAGSLVVELISKLGLDVMLQRRVERVEANMENTVEKVVFEDGEKIDCTCIMFCTGIKARDELAKAAGITCADGPGGVVVNGNLETSEPDVYAIGECASWQNQTFGLIAPGIEMADVLAFNLTQAKIHKARTFKRPDLSTKLKLLGVEVASFGDFFADRDGPKDMPGRKHGTRNGSKQDGQASPKQVKALTYKDPFQAVYKKYLFTLDGEYLLGGMMIGDTKDYIKLVPLVKKQQKLEVPPSQFILGASKEGEDDGADLDDDTQICSCHNVTKGDVCKVVKEGTCKSIGEVKSCTKAGTGCGGCMPLVQSIFNKQMEDMGEEISNHLCPHFKYSRQDLYNIISIKEIRDLPTLMRNHGTRPDSLGCEVCKPAVGSIFASLYNQHVMSQKMHGLQDTNDKFLANIQRNGTFSVIPRIAGGEVTADKLIAIGIVAKRFGLYVKITGGQRIDLFGAKKQDLPAIWRELIAAGMESGHAYAKSLRTVKSCVGTTWCRFGIGDSVGMAVRLEERYKSIRSPHKLKGGVSGCVRECAEAQNKDFGLIATEKGYNIFVGGNGGMRPRHSEILARDVPPDEVVPILDRYLMFYVRTADKLQRTARWIEALPGGIAYLREVVLNDKLGIAADLERQMQALVGTFFCEWTQVLSDPDLEAKFSQFANTSDTLPTMDEVQERGQTRPTYWAQDAAIVDFKNHQWSALAWQPMLESSYFRDAANTPSGMSAAVKRGDTQLAIFWAKGRLYCTQQMCPHKRAFVLSDGLIGEDVSEPTSTGQDKGEQKIWVSCPNHKRNFLLNGERGERDSVEAQIEKEGTANGAGADCKGAKAGTCINDDSLSVAMFEVEQRDDGWIYIKLPPVEELDALLGTKRWMVRKEEAVDPFVKMDLKLGNMGRKGRRVVGGVVEQCDKSMAGKGMTESAQAIDW